ncbi:MAG: hypothetical protein QM817_25550 [Archangium sp.]
MRSAGIALLLLLNGCASVGVFQSAETLGRKNWELGVELSTQAATSFDSLSVYGLSGVHFRYGISDPIDVGLRVGPAGVEVSSKFMLTPRGNAAIVSLAPSVGGTFSVPSGIAIGTGQASLPVLIGVPLSQRLQLVLAPKLHDSLFAMSAGQAGGTVNQVFLGGAVGVVIKLGRFKIIPDVGFLAPIATTTWRF